MRIEAFGADNPKMSYRYCLDCRSEYRQGFERCIDCGVALVDQLPPEPAPEPRQSMTGLGLTATEAWSGFREFDAHVIQSMLQANGIDSEVWSAGLGANVQFDELIAHRVMVKGDDAQEARNLIATID